MKKISIHKSSFRVLALSASIVLAIAALALTAHYAKSVAQQNTSRNAAAASAAQANRAASLKAGMRAALPFDTDQSCGINCTATVPATGAINSAINFQGSASASGCATTPTFEWNFGDGSPVSTQQNPTKTYTAAGTYTWTMTTSASTGATGIDTFVGGYGEGNAALQSPFSVILALARDPLGRGVYLVERLNDTSYIRFVNTTGAPVTIAGKTIAAGANRFLAGGGLDISTENVRGSSVDLGNVAGIGVKPDGTLLYYTNSLDQNMRVINLGSTALTITGGTVNPGNVRTFQVSGASFGTALSAVAVAANGDIYVCDASPGINKVYRITETGTATTFAGNGLSTQDVDAFSPGQATAIPLLAPRAIEFDGNDTYIADTGHGRVIKVTGGAATLISQFTIGSGAKLKAFAPFDTAPIVPPFPSGLAYFGGKLYIAMGNSQVVVRMDGTTPTIVSGAKTTSCEYTSTNCGDGGAISGLLYSLNGSSGAGQPIVGFEADPNGVYIADQTSPQRGRVRFLNFGNSTASVNGVAINANSGDTIIGNGSSLPYNGNLASSAGIFSPSGVTLDPSGNLYFIERSAGRIRYVNRGTSPVTLFGGTDSAQTVLPGRITTINRDLNLGNTAAEGPVIRTTFDNPQGIFATANGVFIVDTQGGPSVKTNPNDSATTINKTRTSLVRFFNTSNSNVTFYPGSLSNIIVPPGSIGTIVGGGTSSPSVAPEGFALSIVLAGASDIVVTADGTMYIADTGNKKVRKINPNTGTSSSLTLPTGAKQYVGLALDSAGKLYICNYDDSQLLRENTAGGGSFARMDGGGLNRPRDVVVDSEGNAYVINSQVSDASPGTNANQIVRVAAAGGAATTFAGGSSAGFSGDGGLAVGAQISVSPANPSYTVGSPNNTAPIVLGIVRDTATGQIFFSDPGNERLRVLSTAFASCSKTGTITIAGSNPSPTLASISPTSALAGSGAQTITLTGTGFVPSSVVKWNGADRATTYVSGTQLTVQIPATDITAAGTALITVFNAAPGGGTSTAQTFTITSPNLVPTLTNLSPSSAAEGSPAFTLTVTGTNFVNGSVVRWDGSARATTFVSATQLNVQITSTDLAGGGGVAQVTVFNPAPGGGTSNSLPFTITTTNPVPALTNLSPGQATSGGAAFTLTVTGSSFVAASVVRWNGNNRATTFVSSTSLTAQILASDIASAGSAVITVFTPTPGGGVSNSLNFAVSQSANPVPTITIVNPLGAQAGGAAFTLTVTGTNFIPSSVVNWNGSSRTTTFVSATELTAQITATDIASAGSAQITVTNPPSTGGGGGTSNARAFVVSQAPNPTPTLTGLNPNSVIAGSAAFTLTLTGTNFINGSVVRFNGADRTTTFVNSTTLSIQVQASEVASAGSASLTVFNPAPGGGTSGAQTLSIVTSNPIPTVTTLSPVSATAGGAAFTLTVNGTNFISSSVVRWNGTDRTTTFVSATQLSAQISAADIASAGTAAITVATPAPGGGTSNSVNFSIVQPNPVPTISSISPSTTSTGGPAFTLTVTGTGFLPSSVVRVNGVDRNTTFVSATSLTIQIAASDIASAGSAAITVFNPAPGGGTSGAQTLSIVTNNPTPTITTLNPVSATAGGAAFTLTVNGTNFISSSVVRWNGIDRATTVVSATQLTAQITATDIANAGTAAVTVTNPAPGGGTSNSVNFTIIQPNPAPTISGISPSTVIAGGPAFTLTVTGTGFVPTSMVRLNGADRNTTYVSATSLTIQVSAAEIASVGSATITVFNPAPGGGTSNASTLTIQAGNLVPTLTSLNPTTVNAGGGNLLLTVTGTNFVNASTVQWNGANRPTTFVSSTQLTAQIPAADIATASTASITVFNPAPGGGTSNALTLPVVQPNNPVPTLTNLSQNSAPAGSATFNLTLTGTNFINGSVIRFNNQNRTTTFLSSTQLSTQLLANDLASAGTIAITVFNPAPGGGTSNAVNFTVTAPQNPVPVITTINPNIVGAGGATFTLIVNGTGFINGSIVRFNNAERATTYVSATQVSAQILASDIVNLGTASITVFNPASAGGGGGISNAVNLTIATLNPAPTIAQINPSLVTAGGAKFTLTVTGTGFTPSSVIRFKGSDRLTMYVSNTTLTMEVAATDIATAGTATVVVFNGAPGGGTSNSVTMTIANSVASVSAASYTQVIAPDSISAAFGLNLATGLEVASTVPLPTSLRGTTVRVRDGAGTERVASLFFVSATQVNYLVPSGLATGQGTVTITSGDGTISVGRVQIERVEPGMFSANASGIGVMASVALRVRANGEQVYEELSRFENGVAVPVPLDLGPATDQVFLIAFGTGLRNRNDLTSVTAKLGNNNLPVLFAGPQGGLVGLDQLNLGPIPRSMAGSGSVELAVVVEGKAANKVTLTLR